MEHCHFETPWSRRLDEEEQSLVLQKASFLGGAQWRFADLT